jgi:hypothetical protein
MEHLSIVALGYIAGVSRVKKKNISKVRSRVLIQGEGRDEWGNRYYKLAVKGSSVDLPPFSMEQIGSDPDSLYKALSNVGLNILRPKMPF